MSSRSQHRSALTTPRRARRLRVGASALVAASALGLAGCTAPASSNTTAAPAGGNSIVIGAEQEPDCTDWIATCAGSIWGSYMMEGTTIPTAFDTRQDGEDWVFTASNLLAGEPTVTVEGGKQTMTYTIAEDAVWSDGEPITSQDFKYTALEIRDGDDIFDKTGYTYIEDVATPDPKTAVVTLSSPYGAWKQLFGGSYGIFPSHLLEGQDRAAIMKDGYDFSGGPWIIEAWDKGSSVTLVPNENYWGEKPKLDKVTFQFITDTAAAFQALKSGQVQALYPTPQLDALTQIEEGIPNTELAVSADTGNLEAVWINNSVAPFDSLAVRQALAYSIDREAIVERLYGPLGVTAPAQSFLSPMVSAFAGDDFKKYSLDLEHVDELMTGDGWEKNGDGIWEKNGTTASFDIASMAGNKRRELTEQVLQSQLKDAGFELTIANTSVAELFGTVAPTGDYDLGLWTLVDQYPEPSLSASFSSGAIPTEGNGFSGINFMRATAPGLDELLGTVDTAVESTVRLDASLEADTLIADNVLSIPVAAVPNILMTNTSVGGPISLNPAEGPFWNLEEWTRG
ncbi:peptide ABC transporter substrate-binding protein [Rathayibacter sp. VKM Ac-2760]|uniref:peptide ABC transporter substrate-binding protein n=1 Tax=Rathayibacter sp. VKM Ac-2760 TaxID=2609253 RepID=UPI001316D829|nr:peptide ABC transporter substrate-binding protein [Rathayibacter sp. VKM Ac-2760]QHC61198.1 peptide ABC transporter substrate-binding protein [Rathayibacter sp. VKM Ac-2760]